MKVKEIISGEQVSFCFQSTTLHSAAKLMADNNCGALPVVDKEHKVTGIITDRDICLAMARKHPKSPTRLTVGEIMPKGVHTVKEENEIAAAYQKMRVHQVSRIPVVDNNGKLTGIISLHKMFTGTIERKRYLGNVTDEGESLMKTLAAISGRYVNGKSVESAKTKK